MHGAHDGRQGPSMGLMCRGIRTCRPSAMPPAARTATLSKPFSCSASTTPGTRQSADVGPQPWPPLSLPCTYGKPLRHFMPSASQVLRARPSHGL